MSDLRTNYKDDVFTGSRKYRMIDNGDGTVSFEDVTEYVQEGDTYGAAEINEVNTRLNGLAGGVYKTEDAEETELANNDYFPFIDKTYAPNGARRKIKVSNIIDFLKSSFSIKSHESSTASTYGAATSSRYGHAKLSDNYTSGTSTANSSVGASEYAVTSAYTDVYRTLNTNGSAPGGSGQRFYFDYKNGKYGWNESASRGENTFHPFSNYSSIGIGFGVGRVSTSRTETLPAGTYFAYAICKHWGNYGGSVSLSYPGFSWGVDAGTDPDDVSTRDGATTFRLTQDTQVTMSCTQDQGNIEMTFACGWVVRTGD